MKTSFLAMVLLAVSTCYGDPAIPYGKELLSDSRNLEINTEVWQVAYGVLSTRNSLSIVDHVVLVKEKTLAVPGWYHLSCQLLPLSERGGRLDQAGLVFGFVDARNYWSVTLADGPSLTLRLRQISNGEQAFCTEVPVQDGQNLPAVLLGVEVHHPDTVRVFVNSAHVMEHSVKGGVPMGRVGFYAESGRCAFTKARISGIAKR